MNEMIAIRHTHMQDGTEVNTVNARDLHGKLGVDTDFSDWIKYQLKRARLVEERDYLIETRKLGNQTGRGGDRRSKDYFLTLDAAKHIAMISGTEMGYKIREYFIEFEKRHSVQPKLTREQQITSALLLSQEIIEEQNQKIAQITEYNHKLSLENREVKGERDDLKEELGHHGTYRLAKANKWMKDYFNSKLDGTWKAIGLQLKNLSDALGYQIRTVPNADYGKLNLYHVDVIEEFKIQLDADYNWMRKYRRYDRI